MKYSILLNSSNIFLSQEIEEWFLLLTRLEKSLYTHKDFKSVLSEVCIDYSLALTQTIKVNKLSLSDTSHLEELFSEIKVFLHALPVLNLTLAFCPDMHFLDQIKENISQSISQVILDISYDPTLVAGITIAWKGIYRDYSLVKELPIYENI